MTKISHCKKSHLAAWLLLLILTGSDIQQAFAVSWLAEGAREFEELRMRQLQTVQNQGEIAPFTTDGCSGYQSKSWEFLADKLPGFKNQFGSKPPWEDCCVAHDKIYWRGEANDGYAKRQLADQALMNCVIATGSKLATELSIKYATTPENIRLLFDTTANLMYHAVRLGGQPCSLLPWRWGYGWPNCAFVAINGKPAQQSNITSDEQVVLFNTAAWLDADHLHWHIPIHAWIYKSPNSVVRKGVLEEILKATYDLSTTPETEHNFDRRINLLISDNRENKKLVIRIAGQDFVLDASQENGHVSSTLALPADLIDAYADQGGIHYIAVLASQDNRHIEGYIQLIPESGTSVISDIDDTVKVTNVTDHKLLFRNTFYDDFRAVRNMATFYQQLTVHGAVIHFVSSSPWQLYQPLWEFLQKAGFPWTTLDLKYVRFKDKTLLNLFKNGLETKPRQIEPILQHYPDRKFILIGDSGEQDPEVYGDLARRFPRQISSILIHNVDHSQVQDIRYQQAFANIPSHKWQLFDDPAQLKIDNLIPRQ